MVTSSRPQALLIVPIPPAARGNGLAMRGGMLLDGLAADCDVTLVLIPVAGPAPGTWSAFVTSRTVARHVVPDAAASDSIVPPDRTSVLRLATYPAAARPVTPALAGRIAQAVGDAAFDIVVVSRLYLAPAVASFVEGHRARSALLLDLDDDEVATHESLSRLALLRGDPERADIERDESTRYRVMESAWLQQFDAATVCAHADRAAVAARTGHRSIDLVPNGVALPDRAIGDRPSSDGPVRLLFVGSLSYAPNIDAVEQLCRVVLPALRARTRRAVQVDIVGARPTDGVRSLAQLDGVTLHADVDDVTAFYGVAHLAAVPLRAGGGTRIKILEAMAHGTPVVSTPAGAEGIDVVSGSHLLVADLVDPFVDACARVLAERTLGRALATSARHLIEVQYTWMAAGDRLRGLVRRLLTRSGR